jgi:hypothetical protein
MGRVHDEAITIAPGDVISYIEMCQTEGTSLQRGMNFHLAGRISVILMSIRRGAPYAVKLEVWKRDKGKCVLCGNRENLHFDHVIPFSLGGSSLSAKNIQLLCARHNLQKHDKII